jgi:hypothetical protein
MNELPKALLDFVVDYKRAIRLRDRTFEYQTIFVWAWDNAALSHKPFLTTRKHMLYTATKEKQWTILCSAPMLVELVKWAAEHSIARIWKDFWANKSIDVTEFADIIIQELGGH